MKWLRQFRQWYRKRRAERIRREVRMLYFWTHVRTTPIWERVKFYDALDALTTDELLDMMK